MKKLGIPAIAAAVYAGLTADQWIMILSAVATIINVIIEVLKERRRRKEQEDSEP